MLRELFSTFAKEFLNTWSYFVRKKNKFLQILLGRYFWAIFLKRFSREFGRKKTSSWFLEQSKNRKTLRFVKKCIWSVENFSENIFTNDFIYNYEWKYCGIKKMCGIGINCNCNCKNFQSILWQNSSSNVLSNLMEIFREIFRLAQKS